MSERKNIVASVKGRLLNIARTERKNHQLLLLRYFQERFLFPMIDLGKINTRMKDFYDVYHLLKSHAINPDVLEQAIRETFKRRGTATPPNHSLFLPAFYLDENRITLWKAWIRKAQLDRGLAFSEVMSLIASRLEPIYRRMS